MSLLEEELENINVYCNKMPKGTILDQLSTEKGGFSTESQAMWPPALGQWSLSSSWQEHLTKESLQKQRRKG